MQREDDEEIQGEDSQPSTSQGEKPQGKPILSTP